MGIFGLSYPPGCNGTPYDEDYPCEVCGKSEDDCICPECPVCGEVGRPQCYEEHGMNLSLEQTKSKEEADAAINAQMQKENEGYDLMIEQQIIEDANE